MDDLIERLNLSKGSASQGLKYLQDLGAVRAVYAGGDRRTHYEAVKVTQWLTGGRSPLHPARVRKTTLSTHIVPEMLTELGFNFRYDFAASLKDWSGKSPEDFLE